MTLTLEKGKQPWKFLQGKEKSDCFGFYRIRSVDSSSPVHGVQAEARRLSLMVQANKEAMNHLPSPIKKKRVPVFQRSETRYI